MAPNKTERLVEMSGEELTAVRGGYETVGDALSKGDIPGKTLRFRAMLCDWYTYSGGAYAKSI